MMCCMLVSHTLVPTTETKDALTPLAAPFARTVTFTSPAGSLKTVATIGGRGPWGTWNVTAVTTPPGAHSCNDGAPCA